MPRIVTKQPSHTYGVLDPLMQERSDTKFFHGSLSAGENVIMQPQGGYSDRGGTTIASRARRRLVATTPGLDFNAPNGGNVASLTGSGDFTTGAVNADPFVLFTINFDAVFAPAAFDLVNFKCSTLHRPDCLQVQYFADGGWNNFGSAFDITGEKRSRRAARAPGLTVGSTLWRVVVTGGAGIGTITVGEVRFRTETALLSLGCKVLRYNRQGQKFQIVATDENIDIFLDGVWKAAASLPLQDVSIIELKHEPAYDTILFAQQDLVPWRLQRQGADDEWQFDAAPFENIPLVDYGDTIYTNGVAEVQEIQFYNMNSGEQFILTLEGNTTTAIAIGASDAATAANIQTALLALPVVSPGLTVTSLGGNKYEVTFAGDGNKDRDWLEMSARTLDEDGVVIIRTKTEGKEGGEPVFSAARGYPAVLRYVQSRLLAAGFKGRAQSYLVSVTGEPFNLDAERAGETAGFLYDIDDDDVNTIRDVVVGRTVMFFTDTALWHLGNRKMSAEEVPDLLKSDAPGIAAAARPLSLDNAIFYVQRGGKTLRQVTYDAIEENFLADNASVLSAFLLKKPREIVLRRAITSNDADVMFLVNADGSLTTVTMMRTQEVSGFAPSKTRSGSFKSACVDSDQTVWFLTQRLYSGAQNLLLEKMEPEKLLDGAIEITLGAPGKVLSGLSVYDGQTLWVIGDGEPIGEFTVAGGQIALPRNVSTARVGFWAPPLAVDQPYSPDTEVPLARLKRVFAADISVFETSSIAIAVNGEAPADMPLGRFDDTPLDTPWSAMPFTGTLRAEGMPGFTETAQLTVTQVRPGRLTVRGVKKEIRA